MSALPLTAPHPRPTPPAPPLGWSLATISEGVRLTHSNGAQLDVHAGIDVPLAEGRIATRHPVWTQAQWWSVYALLGWLRHANTVSNYPVTNAPAA